jgi:hypothetical protein
LPLALSRGGAENNATTNDDWDVEDAADARIVPSEYGKGELAESNT